MSGFSSPRNGLDNRAKQYGSILRGYGPPVPKAGVVGDLYIDNVSFQLFEKRSDGGLDDWGHYLFVVPFAYRNLKWFGASAPANTLGRLGDYFLQWAGYANYGMQLIIWGPKLPIGWAENGEGAKLPISNANKVHSLGVLDTGPDVVDVFPNQLVAVGLFEDYVIPYPVTANAGDNVSQIGVPNTGTLVFVTFNPLYTAEDEHAL